MRYAVYKVFREADGSTTEELMPDRVYRYRDDAVETVRRLARQAPEPDARPCKYTVRPMFAPEEERQVLAQCVHLSNDAVRSDRTGYYMALPQDLREKMPGLIAPYLYFEPADPAAGADDGASRVYVRHYPDMEAAYSRRMTADRLGGLLTKHAKMPANEIHHIVQKLNADRIDSDYSITADRRIIQEAFIRTSMRSESSAHESCMRHTFDVAARFHPCNAYGGTDSDLQLAVMRRKSDSMLVARSVVWPERKCYVRVYGINEAMRAGLTRWLEHEQGFQRAPGFGGAKIALNKHPSRPDTIMVPYLDGNVQFCNKNGVVDGDRNGIPLQRTTGMYTTQPQPMVTCARCEEEVPQRSTTHVYGLNPSRPAVRWCAPCVTAHARRCERDNVVTSESTERVIVAAGRHGAHTQRWRRSAMRSAAFYCEFSAAYYSRDVFTPVSVDYMGATMGGCSEVLTLTYDETTGRHGVNMRSTRMRKMLMDRGYLANTATVPFVPAEIVPAPVVPPTTSRYDSSTSSTTSTSATTATAWVVANSGSRW